MEVVAVLVAVGVMFALAWAVGKGHKQRRGAVVDRIARALGGAQLTTAMASGKRHGMALTYRFADRGIGSSHEPWTEIDVEIPARYPLTIRIERGQPSREQVRAGEVIDIEIGERRFDDEFLVEAAPADVIEHLIDADARAFMIDRTGSIQLGTTDADGRRVLRLAVPGWVEEEARAISLADGVSRIASRIRDAYAAADDKVAAVDVGSPYRPERDQQPAVDTQRKRDREIAVVEQVKQERAARIHATQRAVLITVFGALLLMIVIAVAIAAR